LIVSFGDKRTEEVFHGEATKRVKRLDAGLVQATQRKLDMVDAAHQLDDLRMPPGNRLEALRGDLAGFYSIRVNQQWRLIFEWRDGNAHGVRLVDYHG